MATANFSDLLNEVCKIDLAFLRVNDITIGADTFAIAIEDDPSNADSYLLYLVGTDGNKFKLTVRQLAGLRLRTSKELDCEWLHLFKGSEGAAVFQSEALAMSTARKSIKDCKFRCVAQLKVKNDFAQYPDTPVYKDSCYEGREEYTRNLRALTKGKDKNFWSTPEYGFASRALRTALHSSPLKKDQANDDNLVLLPIFEIV